MYFGTTTCDMEGPIYVTTRGPSENRHSARITTFNPADGYFSTNIVFIGAAGSPSPVTVGSSLGPTGECIPNTQTVNAVPVEFKRDLNALFPHPINVH
jgi:hypothetical protein